MHSLNLQFKAIRLSTPSGRGMLCDTLSVWQLFYGILNVIRKNKSAEHAGT